MDKDNKYSKDKHEDRIGKNTDKESQNYINENPEEKLNEEEDENLDETVEKYINKNSDKCNTNIDKITSDLININVLKEQLAKFPLNPEQKVYYDIEIIPLIGVLDALGKLSYNVSTSVANISTVRLAKNSKIEDALKLVYDANKGCREIYDVLKNRIDFLLYPERYK